MVSTTTVEAEAASVTTERQTRKRHSPYPLWFHIPGGVLFIVLFAVPTFASFYFSLTRWTLFDTEFIGLENYKLFFTEPMMVTGFVNTFIYGVATSAAKVVLGLALGILLTSQIIARGYLRSVVFFPVLVSTIGVGITFKILLDPFAGSGTIAPDLTGRTRTTPLAVPSSSGGARRARHWIFFFPSIREMG